MLIKDTFEGWIDYTPGWDFDHPTYMVKPVMAYTDSHMGPDELVEEYMMDTAILGVSHGEDLDERRSVLSQFALAKKGKARKGVVYWRKIIEWDTETDFQKVIEDIEYPG